MHRIYQEIAMKARISKIVHTLLGTFLITLVAVHISVFVGWSISFMRTKLTLESIPIYPNAYGIEKNDSVKDQGIGESEGKIISFTTDDEAQQVLDFYKRTLENDGWSYVQDMWRGDMFVRGSGYESFCMTVWAKPPTAFHNVNIRAYRGGCQIGGSF